MAVAALLVVCGREREGLVFGRLPLGLSGSPPRHGPGRAWGLKFRWRLAQPPVVAL
jgi:hypothetical protein